MLKKIFKMSILASILLFCFGLILILNSEGFIKSISTIIGTILLIIGIIPVVDFFRYKMYNSSISLISGIFSIVCGLMFLFNENMLMVLVPVFIGVWMIINGINKFTFSLNIKDQNESSWIITFIFSIIIVLCGIYFIINPIKGVKLVSQTLGIIICIYSVLDIIDCFIIKSKYKEVQKEIDKISNVVDEQ